MPKKQPPRQPNVTEEKYVVLVERDVATGVPVREQWLSAEKGSNSIPSALHRVDGPSLIERNPANGILMTESWKQNGCGHREGGPALIHRNSVTGVVTLEAWMEKGVFHRHDGPARITRNSVTGKITSSEWWIDGERIVGERRRQIASFQQHEHSLR